MDETASRPFYDEYAWAYDLLITPPLSQQCDFIAQRLSDQGVLPGSRLLDAGCGTGRYAVELAQRGYLVKGLDASISLICEAKQRARSAAVEVSFSRGNLLKLVAKPRYDALLCRGVLNDLLLKAQRRQAFFSFARALRAGGALMLDVRDWEATAEKKNREPVFEKDVETTRGLLAFRSETRLDRQARQLLVSERHTLKSRDTVRESSYEFRMQCWTPAELKQMLTDAGFGSLELFGAYDANVAPGLSDRIVCVCRRTE